MAEKRQNTINGSPPQFFQSNSVSQHLGDKHQNPSIAVNSSAANQYSYPFVMQRRPGLMVNGQSTSLSVKNCNLNQYSDQLINSSSDTGANRITYQTKLKSCVLETPNIQTYKSTMPSSENQIQRMTFTNATLKSHHNVLETINSSAPQIGELKLQGSIHSPLHTSSVQKDTLQTTSQLMNNVNTLHMGNPNCMQSVPENPQAYSYNISQPQQTSIIQQYPVASSYGDFPSYPKLPINELQKPISPCGKLNSVNVGGNINSQQLNPSPVNEVPVQGSLTSSTIPCTPHTFPSTVVKDAPSNKSTSNSEGYETMESTQKLSPLNTCVTNSSTFNNPPSSFGTGRGGYRIPMLPNHPTPGRVMELPPQFSTKKAPPVVPGPTVLPTNRMPSAPTSVTSSRYPVNTLSQDMERMTVTKHGFNRMWGLETVDLLQCRNILPPQRVTPPPIRLHQEFLDNVNCSPEIFCCTMNKIPETNSLLQKSRLPLGILIHPFRDLNQLAVIQCASIVRCRACRTYINPFVYFVDNKRWKCNLCFRVNELSDEFQFDPMSKTYGDPSRRPEIRNSTIEFIAPSEYMVRPPQPAIYLFVLDVSRSGCDSGYLETLCSVLLDELDNLPGDSRTQIGFILFDSYIHFFSIAENYTQAHEMIVTDINDIFLPTPDSLLVNLNENKQLVRDLLQELPRKYAESFDNGAALGAALQAAYKLMSPTGGRITLFQSCLPTVGPGNLNSREDPNQRSAKDVRHLGPQTDFYKRLALDCSTQQISVDLFLVSSQYCDLATIGGVSQFSGGCIYHFPLFRKFDVEINERMIRALRRYLTRKIGFEAVMRVRCSRGLSIHTFHGNFFVRSTDLLTLPNVNPDAGFGMQVSIEDSLCELQTVCFQAAVLYTSAKGERRIRVHTLCLPVSSNLSDILTSADQQAIVGLLGKMAVDRSLESSISDAREAFVNVAIDILSAYKLVETSGGPNTILAPLNLSLIPLYILALLKSTAFRTGKSTRLDDRVYAMSQMKTLPLRALIQQIHPDLYNVTELDDETDLEFEDRTVAQPPRLSLSSEHLDSRCAFLLDTPEIIYLLLGRNIDSSFLNSIFDVNDLCEINYEMVDLPDLATEESEKLRHFINYLQSEKAWPVIVRVITEPSVWQPFLINDKTENAFSYFELLHHVKAQMK